MTLAESKIDLDDVRRKIADNWNPETGASFETVSADGIAWSIHVPPYNKKDCWATKSGTTGKQSRTFCRFHTRRGD